MGDKDRERTYDPLSAGEYAMVGAAIFERLAQCESIQGIHLDYQSMDGDNHLGFFTMPGGKILSYDVTGGFEAQLPFQLTYQTRTTSNKGFLAAERLLTETAQELESKPYPLLDGGREITKIHLDGVPYRAQADDSGAVVFVITGSVRYEK